MAGQRSVSTRVDAIEHQLQHVQALANATAKGFGKDKVQRQWVVFAQGEFRARLEEAWGVWKEGAGKVRSEGGVAGSAGSADKPQPFKVQVFGLVREQLGRQGLAEDVCQGLAGLRAEDVVESLQVREPPEDVSKPWVLVVLFRPTWSGLSASQLFRAPAVGQVVGKQGGSYPALGLRPGRFLPGELQRKAGWPAMDLFQACDDGHHRHVLSDRELGSEEAETELSENRYILRTQGAQDV
eukprot:s498_g3.t1